jgi:hypothetical protein
MRGANSSQQTLFSTRLMHDRIPMSHPIRKLRVIVDTVLAQLDERFSRMYSKVGRPSIAPEHLLRALLLQILFSVRSERQLMEQMDYNVTIRRPTSCTQRLRPVAGLLLLATRFGAAAAVPVAGCWASGEVRSAYRPARFVG